MEDGRSLRFCVKSVAFGSCVSDDTCSERVRADRASRRRSGAALPIEPVATSHNTHQILVFCRPPVLYHIFVRWLNWDFVVS